MPIYRERVAKLDPDLLVLRVFPVFPIRSPGDLKAASSQLR